MSVILFANNAGSTLAGSISNTSLSLNLQAGGGALFPNPTTGQYFVITAVDAATGLLREIMWCTSRSGDTLTVVRAQEGTTALAWNAGDLIQELWTAGQAAQMVQAGQAGTVFVPIIPQTSWYVDGVNGTDAAGQGMSSGTGAFKTLNYAISSLSIYFSAAAVTINVAAATYNSNYASNGAVAAIGTSSIALWQFVGSGSSTCIIDGSATGKRGMSVAASQNVSITGFSINGNYECLSVQGSVAVSNCKFTLGGTSSIGVAAYAGATIYASGAITFAGSGQSTMAAVNSGAIQIGASGLNVLEAVTITYSSCTVSEGTIAVGQCGVISFFPAEVTFVGTPTGPRCYISTGGGIASAGSVGGTYPSSYTVAGTITSYIPGTSNGVFAMPGWIA